VTALGGHSTDFVCGQLGIPDDRDGHGDEPVGIGAGPTLNVPVVVGADDSERQSFVRTVAEETAGERRERREVHRGQDPARRHVLDPLVDVPTPAPHLVVRRRIDAVLFAGPAGHGVEADVGDLDTFELPDVVSGLGPHDPGSPVGVLRGQPSREEIRRLHCVIINTDKNQIFDSHIRLLPWGISFGSIPTLYI